LDQLKFYAGNINKVKKKVIRKKRNTKNHKKKHREGRRTHAPKSEQEEDTANQTFWQKKKNTPNNENVNVRTTLKEAKGEKLPHTKKRDIRRGEKGGGGRKREGWKESQR